MINNQTFKKLPINKQLETAVKNGSFIISKKVNNSIVNLYALNGFYVEIWYNLSDSLVDKIVTKDSSDDLTSYVSEINLDKLF